MSRWLKYAKYSLFAYQSLNETYGWHCKECGKYYRYSNRSCHKCPARFISSIDGRSCIPDFVELYINIDDDIASQVIFALSLVVVAIILVCAFFFCKYRDTPVVKSADIVLSFVQITVHLLSAVLLPVVFFGKPTQVGCLVRPFCYGLPFTVIKSIHIGKAQAAVKIFQTSIKMSRSEVVKAKAVQVFIIVFLLSVNILLISVTKMWLTSHGGGGLLAKKISKYIEKYTALTTLRFWCNFVGLWF